MSIATYAPPNDLPNPVTTGTTIQTFQDVNVEWWVAKNNVNSGAWRKAKDVLHGVVYRNATWGPLTATLTVVQYDSTQRDPYGMWGGTPNWGFICPVPGWWRVFVQANGGSSAANSYISVSLWQNTVQRTITNTITPLASGGISARCWWTGYINATDYLSCRVAQGGTGNNMQVGLLNNRLEVSYLGSG